VILYISTGQTSVPSVAGKPADEAKSILTKAGFSITVQSQSSDTVAKDDAIGTDPAKGATVEQKSMITLYVSTGKDQVTIPSGMVNQSLAYVQGRLGTDVTIKVTPADSASDVTAVVTAIKSGNTDLADGGKVDKGATITLTVKTTDASADSSTDGTTADNSSDNNSQSSTDSPNGNASGN
jgi:serine/threonine-protein kinase